MLPLCYPFVTRKQKNNIMQKNKEPVRLRQKQLKNGNVSLYLDIYIDGIRDYEFLKLYLVKERTKQDREINKQTLQLANSIKAKKIVEIQNGEYGFHQSNKKIPFFAYLNSFCAPISDSVGSSKGRSETMVATAKYLHLYEKNDNITMSQITPKWVQGFVRFLDNEAIAWMTRNTRHTVNRPLSSNTKALYYSNLCACLNKAVVEGLIPHSPAKGIRGPKCEESTRMYLTLDEVRKLSGTECRRDDVKRAFLFSCLTGIRKVDIMRLMWRDVHRQGDLHRIIFRQKKTTGQEYLDINNQACKLMGVPGDPEDLIFSLPSMRIITNTIAAWVKKAGINKKITFHCARHTFATMMLDIGTDIYTVSKLLGHRELSTTQIYAKVMDKNKQKAVSNIPNILEKQ